jgi:hypothetical protein
MTPPQHSGKIPGCIGAAQSSLESESHQVHSKSIASHIVRERKQIEDGGQGAEGGVTEEGGDH